MNSQVSHEGLKHKKKKVQKPEMLSEKKNEEARHFGFGESQLLSLWL